MLAAILVPGVSAPASATVGLGAVVTSPGLANGFPEFLDDGNVKLRLCTNDPQCLYQGGAPEYFWYAATAVGGGSEDPNKNLKKYLAGVEATYFNFSISNPPPIFPTAIPGEEVGFGRLRFRVVHLVVGATYKITHPYGVNTFVATDDGNGGGEINYTSDNGCVRGDPPVPNGPCNWDEVGAGVLGDTLEPTKFLRQVDAPDGWLGDTSINGLPSHVTGAPSGHNSVIVEGPNAGVGGPDRDRLEVSDFAVQGQILYPGTPSTPDLADASDTGSSSTDNITSATQPTLKGTTDGFDGTTEVEVNLLVDGATVPAVSTTTVGGKYSVALPALAAGPHTVVAEAAGLRSSPLMFTVDPVAPVVTLGSHPSDPSQWTRPTFAFTSDDTNATFECQLGQGPVAPCASPMTLGTQIDGDHTFNVRATDIAGNVSSPPPFSWRIDTSAPTVTLASHPAAITADTAPAFSFTSDDPGATFECQLSPSITFAPCTSGQTFAAQSDGAYTFNVRAKDFANRVSGPASFSWRIDTMAPIVTLGSRPSDNSAETTPAFTFTSDDSTATFECQLLPSISTFAPCASPMTFPAQIDGDYTFNVRATDFAFRVSAPAASFSWRIDTAAPVVTLGSRPSDITASKTPAFSFTSDDPNATFECQLTPSISTFAPCVSGTAFAAQNDGDHTFTARATDLAGNVSVPASFSWRIDTVAPVVTIGSRPPDNTAEKTPAFTFTSDDSTATFECQLLPSIPTFELCSSPMTFATQDDGDYTFNVRATDLAGNVSGPPPFPWRIDTVAPTVSTHFPAANAVNVSQTGDLTASFAEKVTGVDDATFTLRNNVTGAAVAAAVTYDATTRVATLNPTAALAPATTYTATLAGFSDLAGNPFLAAQSWSFTTEATQVQRYVSRVYLDLFKRAPDPAGLAGWTAKLDSGSPRVAVANAITNSTEYRSKLITGSYAKYLGRTPDPAGMNAWLAAMNRGFTVSQIEAGFIASPEYFAKAGNTNARWVQQLYTDVLGRSAGPSEVNFWTGRLSAGMSRSQVAMGFLLSTERLSTVVNEYYLQLLGRGLDPSGRASWVKILQAGGRNEAIIGGIISSPEYYSKN
jgi:hypothetical protein